MSRARAPMKKIEPEPPITLEELHARVRGLEISLQSLRSPRSLRSMIDTNLKVLELEEENAVLKKKLEDIQGLLGNGRR